MERKETEVVAMMGRAEIDTRPPFSSVKQAVMLFGERVLAGEIYASKLKEITQMRGEGSVIGGGHHQSRIKALTAELEETKQSLEKAKEEASLMERCIQSLKEEMERTKKELREAKARELVLLQNRQEPENMEDLKFIENNVKAHISTKQQELSEENDEEYNFQKKRFVKFASPHALAKVINSGGDNKDHHHEVLERDASMKKVKRKPIMPLIGSWLFAKRKEGVQSPRV
ncbi:WEB family protein [Senna tora]|uniref:WEB family protein n=1 Tax=Senna tora TaxID=362788 RepID=A0A834W524_9FABA|nr:WEB family protein [Senna tora]